MLVEKEFQELYYIALQHPSRESYVEARIDGNLVIKGVDSGRRDACSCLLFANSTIAKLFALTLVNTECKVEIKKVGFTNMKYLEEKGLKEFRFATFKGSDKRNEQAKCYLVRGLIKRNRKGEIIYTV